MEQKFTKHQKQIPKNIRQKSTTDKRQMIELGEKLINKILIKKSIKMKKNIKMKKDEINKKINEMVNYLHENYPSIGDIIEIKTMENAHGNPVASIKAELNAKKPVRLCL